MSKFFNDYYQEYTRLIFSSEVIALLESFKEIAQEVKGKGKIIFAGNGASASIASHGAVDFTKQADIRGITFNEANLITCLSIKLCLS